MNPTPLPEEVFEEQFEDELLEDELYEDELFESGEADDELMEDELFEDGQFEDELLEDELYEADLPAIAQHVWEFWSRQPEDVKMILKTQAQNLWQLRHVYLNQLVNLAYRIGAKAGLSPQQAVLRAGMQLGATPRPGAIPPGIATPTPKGKPGMSPVQVKQYQRRKAQRLPARKQMEMYGPELESFDFEQAGPEDFELEGFDFESGDLEGLDFEEFDLEAFDLEDLETLPGGEGNRRTKAYIRWVQASLNKILSAGLIPSGRLGPKTRRAIIAFQRSRGLRPIGRVGPRTEGALIAAGATPPPGKRLPTRQPTGPGRAPAVPAAPAGLTGLRARIVQIAQRELQRWGNGKKKETDPTMRKTLENYWRLGTGSLPTQANWWSGVPWSAAFISYVMRQAGAGTAFRYAAGHSYYITAARKNRLSRSSNPIQAYRTQEVAPQPGDIVCKNRAGSNATYDTIQEGMPSHCDIVIARQPGKLITVGGNLSDSVRTTEVRINSSGKIIQPGYFAVIKVGR